MTLGPGSRLGPYEVTALIGEGGMGKVWRGHHTGLRRDDALKVLPDAFASDPDRLARFQREAQVLASLNHPNIAQVHGLEQSDGVQALVMELVAGPTLADRIAQGPIPIDEALPIARQIAEALEAAHEQGIIHRDLKPANIKLRPDGAVKVLDFGLAKALEPARTRGIDATASPTITSPAMMTGVGVILGTAAYMAPEQAKGRAVDKRADIWAFGCVVYEMLTGRRAFEGENVSDTLAAVLRAEADWSALAAETPPTVRALLKRCLEKDPRKRVGDIAAALFALDHAQASPAFATSATGPGSSWRRAVLFAAAGTVAGGLVVAAATRFVTPSESPRVTRLTVVHSGAEQPAIGGLNRDLAITPDGTHVVYIGNKGTQILVRPLDQLEPTLLAATSRPRDLFVSPDGAWVGFVDNRTNFRKIAMGGGPPITIGEYLGGSRGATWMPDDTIVFATADTATGLQRVSATGGDATVLTRPDTKSGEVDHLWPEILPDGRHVLFTIIAATGGLGRAQIAVLDLSTGSYKTVLRGGTHAHYVGTGHLVYAVEGTLRAAAFDLNRLETRGSPAAVVPRLVTQTVGVADFDVASNGTLAYLDAPGSGSLANRTLVWVDRQGREQAITVPSKTYTYPAVSPDGSRVAVAQAALEESDIWIVDPARSTQTRVTFDPSVDSDPVWVPDGRYLIFSSARAGPSNVYWQSADGTGAIARLTESANRQAPTGVSPDGRFVVFTESGAQGDDLMMLTLDRSAPPGAGEARQDIAKNQPLLQTAFNERNGVISPDGRWLAYESDSTGRLEIYVRPFPDVSSRQWQVSNAGGTRPLWTRNGRELFFAGGDGSLMAVPVEASTAAWSAGTPAKLLEAGHLFVQGFPNRTYDVSPDGSRFLIVKETAVAGVDPPRIIIVQNWLEELKRLVPTN